VAHTCHPSEGVKNKIGKFLAQPCLGKKQNPFSKTTRAKKGWWSSSCTAGLAGKLETLTLNHSFTKK
jgi:hypothetical protein